MNRFTDTWLILAVGYGATSGAQLRSPLQKTKSAQLLTAVGFVLLHDTCISFGGGATSL